MIPELLAPAGNVACAIAAVQNGADAVYLGLKQGSARAGADNFTWQELEETLQYAHQRNCRVYLAINTLFTEDELPQALGDAKKAGDLGIDALIVQDLGLGSSLLQMRATGKIPAHTEIHASTQKSRVRPIDYRKRIIHRRAHGIVPRGASRRMLYPRGIMYVLLRPMFAQQFHRRTQRQQRGLCSALPHGLPLGQ